MPPRPDHGETSYKGNGRLMGKKRDHGRRFWRRTGGRRLSRLCLRLWLSLLLLFLRLSHDRLQRLLLGGSSRNRPKRRDWAHGKDMLDTG